MKAEVILYSRTRNSDYRWICRPRNLELATRELQFLLDLFSKVKAARSSGLFPQLEESVVLFRFGSATLLLKAGVTDLRDQTNRNIFALQGYYIREYADLPSSGLISLILAEPNHLDVWKHLDFERGDTLFQSEAKVEFTVPARQGTNGVVEGAELERAMSSRVVPFDERGRNVLLQILGAKKHSSVSFGFGLPRSLEPQGLKFDFTAYIEDMQTTAPLPKPVTVASDLGPIPEFTHPELIRPGSEPPPSPRSPGAKGQDAQIEVVLRIRGETAPYRVCFALSEMGPSTEPPVPAALSGEFLVQDLKRLLTDPEGMPEIVHEWSDFVSQALREGAILSPGRGHYWWSIRLKVQAARGAKNLIARILGR